MVILYKIPVAGVNRGVTLNINSLGEHPVCVNININISTRYGVGCILPLVYDADQTASVYVDNTNTAFTGCWKMPDYVDGNTIPQGYCDTAAATQAKTASCTSFALANKSYIMVVIRNANSYNGKITLNINGTGAKDVYINGTVSSSSNKTLAAGSYLVYYQDSKFYFRTDGLITGSITGDAATVNGKTVVTTLGSDDTTVPTSKAVKDYIDSQRLIPLGRFTGGTSYAKNSMVSVNNGIYVANGSTENTPVGVLTDVDGSRIVLKTGDGDGYGLVDTSVSDDWDYIMDTV